MKKALVVVLALLVAVGGGFGAWWFLRERALDAFAQAPFGSGETKTVEIPPGTAALKMGALLARGAIVSDADSFYRLARRRQVGNKLKAGEYEFAGPLTPLQVIDKIVKGEVKTYRFTVPEGLRWEDILDIVAKSDLKLDRAKLEQLVKSPAFLKKAGVPGDGIEGFLFPDTYVFPRGVDEEAVLTKMVARTVEEYRRANAHHKAGINLDLHQAITFASIVEKETGAAAERPHIACVFHNRMRLKMRLDTDPTVLYAMMLIRGKYVNNITAQDLKTPHPYNTYTMVGLPPGPIASPGTAALEAVLSPPDCKDLYFVSRNDGTSEFCPDLKCHNAAVEKWQRQYFRDKKKHHSR